MKAKFDPAAKLETDRKIAGYDLWTGQNRLDLRITRRQVSRNLDYVNFEAWQFLSVPVAMKMFRLPKK